MFIYNKRAKEKEIVLKKMKEIQLNKTIPRYPPIIVVQPGR